MAQEPKRLYRSRTDRMVRGALGGLAEYLGADPSIVRIVYAVGTFFTGCIPGIILYVAMAVIVREEPAAAGEQQQEARD